LDKVNSYDCKWYSVWNKKTKSYYAIADRRYGITGLHRLITDCPKNLVVDHINHNTLDNTRKNLRNVTNSENMQNLRLYKTNTSGHRNVYFIKGKWVVTMFVNGEKLKFGKFDADDLEQAVEVARRAREEFMPGYIKSSYGG
jgi:hypothetical protein